MEVTEVVQRSEKSARLVRGDGFPIAGTWWCRLNVGFLNHEERTRLTSHVLVVGFAYKGDKDGMGNN